MARKGTKKEKIISKAVEIVKSNPDGIRYTELIAELHAQYPDFAHGTITGAVWDLDQQIPDQIYKPERGRFRHTQYRGEDLRDEKKPEDSSRSVLSPVARSKGYSRGEYGPPIDFRGLRHAPINEQGVVYLFGMLSQELGFLVEAVRTSYPDCEAKRCVNPGASRKRWQRVDIEFEYRSSNFREHRHDPAKCHLIVCWEHDWPDCPLEVIELRREVKELKSKE